MPTINANGCGFYYEQHGRGRDIVFIHGEIHGLEYWEQQIADLSKDYRCFCYNRRGHAKTSWTDYGFSLVNQTRDLESLIGCAGISRPIIIAVAFGTTIAANYAIQNPGNVGGLVLGAWSEMHDALRYFERWAQYSERAATVLERQGDGGDRQCRGRCPGRVRRRAHRDARDAGTRVVRAASGAMVCGLTVAERDWGAC